MIHIRKHIISGLIIACVSLSIYLWYNNYRHIDMPFKCMTFTTWDLSENNQKIILRLAQDIRFENNHTGHFLIKGTVDNNGKISELNRVLELGEGGQVDKDTFVYNIKKIVASSIDNTPDNIFNYWLSEVTARPDELQLDVIEISPDIWLLGGPLSFLSACTRY